jgi:hypothetical protein
MQPRICQHIHYLVTALNGGTVRGYRLGFSFVGSQEQPSCFDHAPQRHQIFA